VFPSRYRLTGSEALRRRPSPLRDSIRRPAWAAAALALAGFAAPSGAAPRLDRNEACFAAEAPVSPGLEVYQQAPPPLPRGGGDYAFYPATAFASQSMERIWQARREPYQLYYFQWANRSTEGVINAKGVRIARKANFQPGAGGPRDQRAGFTSTQKADACTLAQTATALGLEASVADGFARDAGVRLVRLEDGGRSGLAGASDLCVAPPKALPPEAAGVLLDYEVQDGRTPDYTLAFLTRYAELVRSAGKRSILLINPFDAPSQVYTGVTAANANRIHRLFDRTTIFVWARNAQRSIPKSLERQMAIIAAGGPVDPKRLIVDFELANTAQEDAAAVRRFIEDRGLAGVIFWRDYAQQGGACDTPVNRKIACIALGRCGAGGGTD
jgi:hypothetical protein